MGQGGFSGQAALIAWKHSFWGWHSLSGENPKEAGADISIPEQS